MRLGEESFSIEAAKAKGRKLPDWYLDEPVLPAGTRTFINAFYLLCTGRPSGGPIPWRDIEEYLERTGLQGPAARLFRASMRAMDNTFMDRLAERRKHEELQRAREGRKLSRGRTRTPRGR